MLSKHPKRTKVIHIRVTELDQDVLIARATKAGKSVSDFAREVLFGEAEARPHVPAPIQDVVPGLDGVWSATRKAMDQFDRSPNVVYEPDPKPARGKFVTSSDGEGGV